MKLSVLSLICIFSLIKISVCLQCPYAFINYNDNICINAYHRKLNQTLTWPDVSRSCFQYGGSTALPAELGNSKTFQEWLRRAMMAAKKFLDETFKSSQAGCIGYWLGINNNNNNNSNSRNNNNGCSMLQICKGGKNSSYFHQIKTLSCNNGTYGGFVCFIKMNVGNGTSTSVGNSIVVTTIKPIRSTQKNEKSSKISIKNSSKSKMPENSSTTAAKNNVNPAKTTRKQINMTMVRKNKPQSTTPTNFVVNSTIYFTTIKDFELLDGVTDEKTFLAEMSSIKSTRFTTTPNNSNYEKEIAKIEKQEQSASQAWKMASISVLVITCVCIIIFLSVRVFVKSDFVNRKFCNNVSASYRRDFD